MVSFISGDCVGFLDPHEEHFFDEDKRRIFSYTWDIDEYHELAAEYGSQWEPFMQDIFHLDEKVFYEGKRYVLWMLCMIEQVFFYCFVVYKMNFTLSVTSTPYSDSPFATRDTRARSLRAPTR